TWRLDGSAIRFPKIGNLRTVVHRPLEGKPKTCTLRREGDQWFASILCEVEVAEPVPRHEPVIALDRGITHFLADSDGKLTPNPRFYERTMARLARRSEEHTSELQSRENLVCRLLLEKKKTSYK